MPIVYYDKSVLKGSGDRHPALVIDEDHPCYKIVREAIDKKSVFHWTREQAYAMYRWYVDGWRSSGLEDEFGEEVSVYSFKDILKKSYYLVPDGKKMRPSDENIEELHAAVEMEKKMMESIGKEEEEGEAV